MCRKRMLIAASALCIAVVGASCSAQRLPAGPVPSSGRMADGKQWTIENLNTATAESYCYGDRDDNCRRYGRLYTWEAAQLGCRSLGDGWRLPTENEWRELARRFGGAFDDAEDRGNAAYHALLRGGSSGFNALLGGGRAHDDGSYDDLDAHGFYWTASASDPGKAWFYNFGRGSTALYRQGEGETPMALSVRCVKEG